jgi:hypothetical protein
LCTELLCQTPLKPDGHLITQLIVVRKEAIGFTKFVLWQSLHAYKQTALLTGAPRPFVHQIINGSPPAKIEIPYTEVGALGNF